jgi:hypothetical protein
VCQKIAFRTATSAKVKSATRRKTPSPVEFYIPELAAGEVPSLRRIRADLHVGQPKAQQIQAELAAHLKDRVPG